MLDAEMQLSAQPISFVVVHCQGNVCRYVTDLPLTALINSVMNPWATAGSALERVRSAFKKHVLSNIETPDLHGFVMTGCDRLIGCHLPMFNVENHRFQCIVEFEMQPEDLHIYLK